MAVIIVLVVVAAVVSITRPVAAGAATGAGFDPGYIISDAEFFDGNAMSTGEVQSFLDSRVGTCRAGSAGPTCLRHYTTDVQARAARAGKCRAIPAAANVSGAAVIAMVGEACGISQKALLVLLEKEQGLVGATAPSASRYRIAMGFGCPDTAACDTNYYGFFNQVYSAAAQFKTYATSPNSFGYRAGRTNNIQYHPNAGCGTKPVYIRNQATAGLYIYTPYTPNAASLANVYGVGDACSSYGNRNFWRLYSDWFGASVPVDTRSYESLDVARVGYSAGDSAVTLEGWAVDPADPDAATDVHAYLYRPDGSSTGVAVRADRSRPDVAAVLPQAGAAHGFAVRMPVTYAGEYRACVYSIRSAGAVSIGCRDVTVTQAAPTGNLDVATVQTVGTDAWIVLQGWAFDGVAPTSTSEVHIYVTDPEGRQVGFPARADRDRGDVGAAHPQAGSAHGFEFSSKLTLQGDYRVCAIAIGTPLLGANNRLLGCSTLPFGPSALVGSLDAAEVRGSGGSHSLSVSGWALDQGYPKERTTVHVYVTGSDGSVSGHPLVAGASRPDLERFYPSAGRAHGFAADIPLGRAGSYSVCAYAISNPALGRNVHRIGCEDVTVGWGASADSSTADARALAPVEPSSVAAPPEAASPEGAAPSPEAAVRP